MKRKYNYQLTEKQSQTLKKMKPGETYTAKDLACPIRTLITLGNHNLVTSEGWKISADIDWSSTVKWKLAE